MEEGLIKNEDFQQLEVMTERELKPSGDTNPTMEDTTNDNCINNNNKPDITAQIDVPTTFENGVTEVSTMEVTVSNSSDEKATIEVTTTSSEIDITPTTTNPSTETVESTSDETLVPVTAANDDSSASNIPSNSVFDTSNITVSEVNNDPSNDNCNNVTSCSDDVNALNDTNVSLIIDSESPVKTNPSISSSTEPSNAIIESSELNLKESTNNDINQESQTIEIENPQQIKSNNPTELTSNISSTSPPIPLAVVTQPIELALPASAVTSNLSTSTEIVSLSNSVTLSTSPMVNISTTAAKTRTSHSKSPKQPQQPTQILMSTLPGAPSIKHPIALSQLKATKSFSQHQHSLSNVITVSNPSVTTTSLMPTTILPQHSATMSLPVTTHVPQITTRTTFVPQHQLLNLPPHSNSSQSVLSTSNVTSPIVTRTVLLSQQPQQHYNTANHSTTTVVSTANGEIVSLPSEFFTTPGGSAGQIFLSRPGGGGAGTTHQVIVQDEANNVISIPEDSFPVFSGVGPNGGIKLEHGRQIHIGESGNKFHILPSGAVVLSSDSASNVISIPEPSPQPAQLPNAPHPIKIEPTNGMTARPPNTELLLKTAKDMLQLQDEDEQPQLVQQQQQPQQVQVVQQQDQQLQYKRVFPGSILEVDESGTILSTSTAPETETEYAISDNVQEMEVGENETYCILESVDGEEQLYAEDPNIMWIEETVEVEQEAIAAAGGAAANGQNMVIILNPNGTVNEELMLANGFNMETIKALSEAIGVGTASSTEELADDNSVQQQPQPLPQPVSLPQQPIQLLPPPSSSSSVSSLHSGITSITSLQHPIPKKLLAGVEPIMSANSLPPGVLDSKPILPLPHSLQLQQHPSQHLVEKSQGQEHHSRVIFTSKDECMLLDDVKDPLLTHPGSGQQIHGKIVTLNGQHHLITTSKPLPNLKRISEPQNVMTPLGTLDLRVGKREDNNTISQYVVNPVHLNSDNSVLKVIDQSTMMIERKRVSDGGQGGGGGSPPKVKRPRLKDENGNGTYLNRKTSSLGALGQALHGEFIGIPRDSRENAVQICPICKFQATTKNPYRHLQDHLARVHFKDRIAAELPTKKPYTCPFAGCDGKQYPDWQAVMRHYIGKKHGILDKYVREQIAQTGIKLPEQYVTRTQVEIA